MTDNEAKLFPVFAASHKEGRAVSILLAVMKASPAYTRDVLKSVGERFGTRNSLDAYIEVPVVNKKSEENVRPDGLLKVMQGDKVVWSCLVEGKIDDNKINPDQITSYLDSARQDEHDALISISNEFAVLPTHLPYKLPKPAGRTPKKPVKVFHWSWRFLLTQAELTLQNSEDLTSQAERYILQEFAYFLENPSTGVRGFDSMSSDWPDLVAHIAGVAGDKRKLKKDALEVLNAVASWHQEQRDIALQLTRKIDSKSSVSVRVERAHVHDLEARVDADAQKLCNEEILETYLDVPNTVSALHIKANVGKRWIYCGMTVRPPQDKSRASACVTWLVNQFKNEDTKDIKVLANWKRRGATDPSLLSDLFEQKERILLDDKSILPSTFTVYLQKDLSGEFSKRRKFIEHLELLVPDFYDRVGQRLQSWVEPPPKMKKEAVIDQSDIDDEASEALEN